MAADEPLEAEILEYLAEHPNAMDTLEGIAGWWLERHRIRVSVEALSRVLERLVESGVLEMKRGLHEPLFRLRDHDRRTGQ